MLTFSAGRPSSLLDGQGHGGERLVDLEQVDVRDAPADLVQQLLDGADRGGREPLRLLAEGWPRRRSAPAASGRSRSARRRPRRPAAPRRRR